MPCQLRRLNDDGSAQSVSPDLVPEFSSLSQGTEARTLKFVPRRWVLALRSTWRRRAVCEASQDVLLLLLPVTGYRLSERGFHSLTEQPASVQYLDLELSDLDRCTRSSAGYSATLRRGRSFESCRCANLKVGFRSWLPAADQFDQIVPW